MTAFDNVVVCREGQVPVKLSDANDFHAVMGATRLCQLKEISDRLDQELAACRTKDQYVTRVSVAIERNSIA